MNDAIRPFLQTTDLKPFATAIREHLEREEAVGKELTSDRIRQTVNENFNTFRNGIKKDERDLRERWRRKIQFFGCNEKSNMPKGQ